MAGNIATFNILTIALDGRRVGVDTAEIERVIPVLNAERTAGALLETHRSRGELYRLERLVGAAGPADAGSALVITIGKNATRLVTFAGSMSDQSVTMTEVLPLPEYACRKQDPFVVWGMIEEARPTGRDALILVTFQFLPEKGSA